MVPIDGRLRENVGLLGSPSFEIPRAASRDLKLLARIDRAERRRRLTLKTRSNLKSMAALLASRWLIAFFAIYAFALTADVFGATNLIAMTLAAGVVFIVSIGVFVVIERASIGFGRLTPEIATVYDPRSGASNGIGSFPTRH